MSAKNCVSRVTIVKSVAFLLSVATAFVSTPNLFAQEQTAANETDPFSIYAADHHAQMPLPSAVSTMTADSIPPFAAHPSLESVLTDRPESKGTASEELSFEENISVSNSALTRKAIDASCRELTEMVAGNLTDEVSLETKKKMIEMAMKMLARDISAQAETRIKAIEAEHSLDKARYQAQLMAMRRVDSTAAQINRVVKPLFHSLEQNRVQAIAAQSNNQWIAQTLVDLEQRFANQQRQLVTASGLNQRNTPKKTIRLTSPEPARVDASQQRIEELQAQVGYLQYQLRAEEDARNARHSSSVRSASFHEPLRPQQHRLEPMNSNQKNYDRNGLSR